MKAHWISFLWFAGLLVCIMSVLAGSGSHHGAEATSSMGPIILDTPTVTETSVAIKTPTETETPTATETFMVTGTLTATETPTPTSQLGSATPTPTASPVPCVNVVWEQAPLPTINAPSSWLSSVAATRPDDVWAVGGYSDGAENHSLTTRWDGAQWRVIPNPDIGDLSGVDALSANDAWAVGPNGTMHWNGTQWNIVSSPLGATSVTAIAADDVWAVDYDSFIHWNGTQWSVVPSPTGANSVDGVATNDVWAAGGDGNILHWDGSQWSIRWRFPLGGFVNLSAASQHDVWAVGSQFVICGIGCNFIAATAAHWDGTAWHSADPWVGEHSYLTGVTALSSGNAYALGYNLDGYFFLHWNGTDWNVTSGTGSVAGTMMGVAAVSPTDAWAVGYTGGGSNEPSHVQVAHLRERPLFNDVPPDNPFYNYIQWMACRYYVSGYEGGTFRPGNSVTRGQLCKIIVLAEGWPIDTKGGPHFTDVPLDNPFYDYIETAYHRDIISGYEDGTFRWGNNVTRGQLCKIVTLARGWAVTCDVEHFCDVPPTDPFFCYIETAYRRGIVSGYSDCTFRPGNSASRAQICKVVYLAHH